MPVKYSDDDYRRYGNDDYSFSLRSDTSRDYARRRRWGDDDDEAMSQLSSPLRLPKIGQPNRRSYSPFELPDDAMIPQRRSTRFEQRDSPIMTRRRYDDVDDVTTDVTPRRQKYKIPEYLLDSDDEDIMTSPAPRPRYMTSPSKFEDDAEDEQVTSTPKVKKHVEMTSQEKRKRAKFDEKAEAGYTMPVSRRRPDPAVGEEEEAMKDIASYIAVRRSFPVEEDEDIQELEHKKYQYRTRGVDYRPKVYNEERSRDRLNSAPMFDMKLRSHVVWEKMYVKFTCTIRGSPPPRIIWYHNMVPIEPLTLAPGTMKISNQYGVHTLEIFQCKLEDSGTYRISAQNYKGEMSSYATLLVRRYDDSKSGYYDIKSGFNLRKPTDYPDVQGMNIPDAEPPVDESKDSLFISSITATEEPEVKSSKVVTFSAPPPGVGKFESVLEMQILAQGESPIEAIKITRNQPCDVTSLPDETSGDVITSKPAIRDEIGGCLSETLFQQPEVRRDTSIRGDVIIEDVVAAVSRNNEQDNDDDE